MNIYILSLTIKQAIVVGSRMTSKKSSDRSEELWFHLKKEILNKCKTFSLQRAIIADFLGLCLIDVIIPFEYQEQYF